MQGIKTGPFKALLVVSRCMFLKAYPFFYVFRSGNITRNIFRTTHLIDVRAPHGPIVGSPKKNQIEN